MLKSVCAVHSSALAYNDLCKEVSEVDILIRKVSGISSFFHASAVRTTELEKCAKEKVLNVRTCRSTSKLDGQSLQLV